MPTMADFFNNIKKICLNSEWGRVKNAVLIFGIFDYQNYWSIVIDAVREE